MALQDLKKYQVYVKRCGAHITIKRYSDLMYRGYKNKRDSYIKCLDSSNNEKSEKSLYRTRTNLIDKINCNITSYSKFITLTFKDAMLDKKEALYEFNKFSKRFEYQFGYKLKYVMVSERQKKRGKKENNLGSWHFHMVCFNDKKIDFNLLKSCWSVGSVDIKKIDSVYNIGLYLAKYITKDTLEHNRNDKLIYTSQGLKKPKENYLMEFKSDTLAGKETYKASYVINSLVVDKLINCDLIEYDLSITNKNIKE